LDRLIHRAVVGVANHVRHRLVDAEAHFLAGLGSKPVGGTQRLDRLPYTSKVSRVGEYLQPHICWCFLRSHAPMSHSLVAHLLDVCPPPPLAPRELSGLSNCFCPAFQPSSHAFHCWTAGARLSSSTKY